MTDNTQPNRLRKIGERTYTTVPQDEGQKMKDYTQTTNFDAAGDAETADGPFGMERVTDHNGPFGEPMYRHADDNEWTFAPNGMVENPDEELLEMLGDRGMDEYTEWFANMIEEQMEEADKVLEEGMPGYPRKFLETQWKKARIAYLAHKAILEEFWDTTVEEATRVVAVETRDWDKGEDQVSGDPVAKQEQFAKESAALYEKYFGNTN